VAAVVLLVLNTTEPHQMDCYKTVLLLLLRYYAITVTITLLVFNSSCPPGIEYQERNSNTNSVISHTNSVIVIMEQFYSSPSGVVNSNNVTVLL